MWFALLLAGLTGFFVRKRWWGAAAFTVMVFIASLWFALLMILNMIIVGRSIGF